MVQKHLQYFPKLISFKFSRFYWKQSETYIKTINSTELLVKFIETSSWKNKYRAFCKCYKYFTSVWDYNSTKCELNLIEVKLFTNPIIQRSKKGNAKLIYFRIHSILLYTASKLLVILNTKVSDYFY